MNKNNSIGIIADDLRQIYMAKYLINKGFKVNIICSENIETDKDNIVIDLFNNPSSLLYIANDMYDLINKSNTIVTPIPFIKINSLMNISNFIFNLSKKDNLCSFLLYAGKIDSSTSRLLDKAKINYIDYYKSEALTIYNSIATAEGIIAEAIIHKNTNLHNSKAIILGYGKCAKTLANKLNGIGAKVTICARNNIDLKLAESIGYGVLDLHNLIMEINNYEYIFNTIPVSLINENILQHVNPESIILDIASLPGGVDKEFAQNHGIQVIHSLGIPGKYSPKSSGIAIAEDLLNYIQSYI